MRVANDDESEREMEERDTLVKRDWVNVSKRTVVIY